MLVFLILVSIAVFIFFIYYNLKLNGGVEETKTKEEKVSNEYPCMLLVSFLFPIAAIYIYCINIGKDNKLAVNAFHYFGISIFIWMIVIGFGLLIGSLV